MVSQDWPEAVKPQAAVRAGTTADAENQTDIPRSSDRARRMSVRGLAAMVGRLPGPL